MGYFSSEQTSESKSKSKTAPLSAEGREWDSIFQNLFMQTLDQGGYDPIPTEKTEYADQARGTTLDAQIKDYQRRLDEIYAKEGKTPKRPVFMPGGGRFGIEKERGQSSVEAEKKDLMKKIDKAQKELDGLGKVTYTDYTLKKREDARVLDAISKYGEGSPEVATARSQIKQEELSQAQTLADVNSNYLKSLKKFVSGDFSYTDQQKQQIDTFVGPIKDVILKTTDDLFAEAARTNTNVGEAINKLSFEIDRSGYDISDALQAAQIQVEKSGDTLLGVLEKVNTSANDKARFEFDLMSKQIDQQTARQAALLGLPPGSMAEKNQALAMKASALKSIELGLAEDFQNKALGIVGETEAGKKSISLARVQLAENQGAKRENVSSIGIGLAESFGAKKEAITGVRGDALIQLEQQRQGQLQATGQGNLPEILAAGQSGLGFQDAKLAGQIGLTQGILGPASHALDIEKQRTFAEATNKSKNTQTSTPSLFSSILSGVSAAAGLATGGINAASGIGLAQTAKANAYNPWAGSVAG